MEYTDQDLVAEHRARYGVEDLPGVPELEAEWRFERHDRIEPSVAVRGGRCFAARFTGYYPLRPAVAVERFDSYRASVAANWRVRFDTEPLERFLSEAATPANTQMCAFGVDARPELEGGRLKFALGGPQPFSPEVVEQLWPHCGEAGLDHPAVRSRIWGVNFDFGFDGRTHPKLYAVFLPHEYEHPFLKELLGEFDGFFDADMLFLRMAYGACAVYFVSSAPSIRELLAEPEQVELGSREVFTLGAAANALRSGGPLTAYNLYSYHRRGEVPPRHAGASPNQSADPR